MSRGCCVKMNVVFTVIIFCLPVFGVPVGYSTYFNGSTCPSGWELVANSSGRIVVSSSDAKNSDILVGTPLKDLEVRVHTHDLAVSVDFEDHGILGVHGGGNKDGACKGDHSASNVSYESSSGMGFVQLLLCTLTDSADSDKYQVPYGAVGFFPGASKTGYNCSKYGSWTELYLASGRAIIPGTKSGNVISNSNPLLSGEVRVHDHLFVSWLDLEDQTFVASTGPNHQFAAHKSYLLSQYSGPAATNIPYIQLMTCVSQIEDFNYTLPSSAFYFATFECTRGTEYVNDFEGYYIVSLQPHGHFAKTFGGKPIPPLSAGGQPHDHQYLIILDANSCTIALASGGTSGWGKSKDYWLQNSTVAVDTTLPYVSLPLCG